MSEPEYVQPDQLEPGPIRNESLPPVLLAQIKQVFERLVLVAEQFDYSVLIGAEWLSEKHQVDILCCRISLAMDAGTTSFQRLFSLNEEIMH